MKRGRKEPGEGTESRDTRMTTEPAKSMTSRARYEPGGRKSGGRLFLRDEEDEHHMTKWANKIGEKLIYGLER